MSLGIRFARIKFDLIQRHLSSAYVFWLGDHEGIFDVCCVIMHCVACSHFINCIALINGHIYLFVFKLKIAIKVLVKRAAINFKVSVIAVLDLNGENIVARVAYLGFR